MRFKRIVGAVIVLAGMAALSGEGRAQLNCSLGQISERVAPQYPVQTEARPITGVVSVLATFGQDGRVTSSKVITGPAVLRFESEAYVRGWRAEPSNDVRQCAITLDYRFEVSPYPCSSHNTVHVRAERVDETHVIMRLGCEGW